MGWQMMNYMIDNKLNKNLYKTIHSFVWQNATKEMDPITIERLLGE